MHQLGFMSLTMSSICPVEMGDELDDADLTDGGFREQWMDRHER